MTKEAVLRLLVSSGTFSCFRFFNRGRALILNYHRFSSDDEPHATSARMFSQHLEYLTTHYQVIPPGELAGRLAEGAELPRSLAAITIDDGYQDAYDIAFPLLRRYRVPAALFVVTDFVSQRSWLWTDKLRYLTLCPPARTIEIRLPDHSLTCALLTRASRLAAADRINALLKRLPDEAKNEAIERIAAQLGVPLPAPPPPQYRAVSWNQARELDRHHLAIESHTVTHPILTGVDDARLRRELSESRAQLEGELHRRVELFCYPNGDHDTRVRKAVAQAGYRCAVTTEPGLVHRRSDPLALRRVHSESDLAHFVQSTCGFEQLKNRFRTVRNGIAGEQVYG